MSNQLIYTGKAKDIYSTEDENVIKSVDVYKRQSVTWLKELTINVGKSKNVSKSMLATSNGGVIGFVTKVYDDTTTISLLSSSSSDSYLASSVKSEDDNQIFGIISRYDNKKKLLEMTQLNSSSNVKVGTEVVTSGLDASLRGSFDQGVGKYFRFGLVNNTNYNVTKEMCIRDRVASSLRKVLSGVHQSHPFW